MGEAGSAFGAVLGLGGLFGTLPALLLFRDLPRKEWRKAVLFIVVLIMTFGVVIPCSIRVFGIWIALIAPFGVMCYPFLTRRRMSIAREP